MGKRRFLSGCIGIYNMYDTPLIHIRHIYIAIVNDYLKFISVLNNIYFLFSVKCTYIAD